MKIHNLIYTLLAAIAVFLLASCSPEDFGFGKKTYSPEDLVEGKAYTVTIEGNVLKLESKISDATSLWITPIGRSQEKAFTVELPFAGEYEVTFGVETPGGIVYGDPYKITLSQNDFSLLSDNKWFYLADKDYKTGDPLPSAETLAKGISKKWYPCDANYGVGQCTAPVMYIAPYDPDGDGKGFTAEEKDDKNVAYRDIVFGTGNWKPNWDPGFQSWLVPENDPYMDSYMTFSMDALNGCVATMYRGESGAKGASTGSNMVGKFNMNLNDKTKPLITFTDCYAMHNTGFDEVCSNYTQDIQIVELTPYVLQLVTKRTNSEGNWYICWNFVSEDVIATKGACIPKADQDLIETAKPKLPTFENIHTDLFTADINGDKYVGSKMTFTLDSETPYDFLWWNGSPNVKAWESVTGGKYNTTWAPALDDKALDNFELTISKASDGSYNYECGEADGKVKITENTLTFDKEISVFAVAGDKRTIELKGNQFYILGNSADDQYLTIGIPETKDENGQVNSYLVAKLAYKKIATGPTGPTKVAIDNSIIHNEGIMWVENGCLRVGFHHYGETGKGLFKDVKSVKLKKNQTITVTFKIKGGVTWSKTPKCALIDNNIKQTWEPGAYDLPDAVVVDTNGGETTVSLTNTTGSTQTFTATCLDLSIQLNGFGDYGGSTDNIDIEIVSCTIQ
ncbi:hypothetical protein [Segatella copri]|uniref:hypothetical protein n=1 Tax=Segatella copri TaxID=165179 RepID=UPI00294ACF05|nr:hypothetical protein [Segatella copri]WOG33051.1 hypothetical protein RJT04_05370 [Segatella copri]